jgi:hypothetical protein
VDLDWPPSVEFTCPVRGGFGLFLGEVLANAIRHGRPGTVPRLAVRCDRVRKELMFEIENAVDGPRSMGSQGGAYSGIDILVALARLFEWRDLGFESSESAFAVRWCVPASERDAPAGAD